MASNEHRNDRSKDIIADDKNPQAPDRNPDAITGAPGSHPGGTAIGSASGAATGAALGAIGGPVGALIGGVAGAVTGAVVGHKAGEAHDPTESGEARTGTKHYDPVAAATNPNPNAVKKDSVQSEQTREGRVVTPD